MPKLLLIASALWFSFSVTALAHDHHDHHDDHEHHAHDHSDQGSQKGGTVIRQEVVVPDVDLRRPQRRPEGASVFRSGYRGLVTGSLVGLSAGYLVSRHDGGWRPLALGAGIGALSGAALGVSLGFFDLATEHRVRAHLVMRDTFYGTIFGGVTGAIAGSLFIIDSGNGEDALVGLTAGAIGGTGLGLLVGILDAALFSQRDEDRRYAPSVAATSDVSGALVVTPSLAGRF